MNERLIYTIGHSTHELEEFINLLRQHGVTAVADVRSQPYGRLEHFRRESLERELSHEGIAYVFLGRQLGARREESESYANGQAAYERIARLPAFQDGLARLERGAADHVITLMCAEKEPLDCHRTVLVCRQLARRDWTIRHILADGSIEEHPETERRLVREMKIERTLFEPDLTRQELIDRAYEKRAGQIAFRPEAEGEEGE